MIELERTARHELGHAIVASLLGCDVGEVLVRRDGLDHAGSCYYSRPRGRAHARVRTTVRNSAEILIVVAIAGMIAEVDADRSLLDDERELYRSGGDVQAACAIARDVLGDDAVAARERLCALMPETRRLLSLPRSRRAMAELYPALIAAGSLDGSRVALTVALKSRRSSRKH